MMPIMTNFEHPFEGQTNPELRRMSMHNRARREEMDAMIFGINPRHTVVRTGSSRRTRGSLFTRIITGTRAAIGNSLIAAGNRMHPAA